jgi:uncharacterized protein YbjT (DUF2867 family)
MKVIVFGATGMVGQGVLRECLLDPEVDQVLSIGRNETGQRHEKLREIVRSDLFDLSPFAAELSGYDACFFCLGVSSAGMSEAAYREMTYDLTIAAASLLAERNREQMTFIYVSGTGTDSTEHGSVMWARVKGATENALMKLPFKAAYMFRPGLIEPMHGATSRTRLYRVFYVAFGPLLPLARALLPGTITTTERVGRAMLNAVKHGAPKPLLENRDINDLANR